MFLSQIGWLISQKFSKLCFMMPSIMRCSSFFCIDRISEAEPRRNVCDSFNALM